MALVPVVWQFTADLSTNYQLHQHHFDHTKHGITSTTNEKLSQFNVKTWLSYKTNEMNVLSNKFTSTSGSLKYRNCAVGTVSKIQRQLAVLWRCTVASHVSREFVCKYFSNAMGLLSWLLLGCIRQLWMASFERRQFVNKFLSRLGFVLLNCWIRCLHS